MPLNKNCLIICLSLFSFFSCKNKENEKTTQFLTYVKNEEYDKAKGLMWKGNGLDNEGTDFYLKNAHELLAKYGIPPENTWEIKYDTGSEKEIFRMIEVTIPFTKENGTTNGNNELEYPCILLRYIYKMPFYGDSIYTFTFGLEPLKKIMAIRDR